MHKMNSWSVIQPYNCWTVKTVSIFSTNNGRAQGSWSKNQNINIVTTVVQSCEPSSHGGSKVSPSVPCCKVTFETAESMKFCGKTIQKIALCQYFPLGVVCFSPF